MQTLQKLDENVINDILNEMEMLHIYGGAGSELSEPNDCSINTNCPCNDEPNTNGQNGGTPCGGNPCGGTPCGGNPCGGTPCGGNPCGGSNYNGNGNGNTGNSINILSNCKKK